MFEISRDTTETSSERFGVTSLYSEISCVQAAHKAARPAAPPRPRAPPLDLRSLRKVPVELGVYAGRTQVGGGDECERRQQARGWRQRWRSPATLSAIIACASVSAPLPRRAVTKSAGGGGPTEAPVI